ncbi:MAG: hypothetical protein HOP28_12885 [Gemmatimonadales bacterium]|nr:hypothetical protein [Gemmatimonadales bacterium]
MNKHDLAPDVQRLIHSSIPSVEALEVLILLVSSDGEVWSPDEVAAALRPSSAAVEMVRPYLALLASDGLLKITTRQDGAHFGYAPTTPAMAEAVRQLVMAYHEQPVLLIRTVYAIADRQKLQAFVDAFKIRKDP